MISKFSKKSFCRLIATSSLVWGCSGGSFEDLAPRKTGSKNDGDASKNPAAIKPERLDAQAEVLNSEGIRPADAFAETVIPPQKSLPEIIAIEMAGRPKLSSDAKVACEQAGVSYKLNDSKPLKELLAVFCNGNDVSDVFKSLLVEAQDPKHTPNLKILKPITSVDRETSVRVAYALRLKISAKDFFNGVLKDNLQPQNLKIINEAAGGEAEIEIRSPLSENAGRNHRRGIRAFVSVNRPVFDTNLDVTNKAVTDYDQFELEAGKSYMTSQFHSDILDSGPVETITLLLTFNDVAYVFGVNNTVVNNRGFEKIAQNSLNYSINTSLANQVKRLRSLGVLPPQP